MIPQVQESKQYDRFDLCNFNRNLRKLNLLETSMRKYGFLTSKHIIVQRNGDLKFHIKEGHHRFYMARKLGIPVKYMIVDEPISIYEIENTANTWTMQDYLDSYCRSKGGDYLKVKEYCEETGVPVSSAVALLGGHTTGTSNYLPKFKDGTYKKKARSNVSLVVKELILCCKESGIKFYSNSYLVSAFSLLAFVDSFRISHMKSKIKLFPFLFEKKAGRDQYLQMLEDVYNRQSRAKVPLKFLAEEAAKTRNVVGLKK